VVGKSSRHRLPVVVVIHRNRIGELVLYPPA
jgi:hypothetical protein